MSETLNMGLSSKDRLFGNLSTARVLLYATTPETFHKNKAEICLLLEYAESWAPLIIALDDTDDRFAK
jgi:hypothetical protein